jgi:DNA-binding response OmpR family regulator
MISLAEEIIAAACQEQPQANPFSGCLRDPSSQRHIQDKSPHSPMMVDEATFSVRWHDKACYLGNTLPFRLLERLARRPNHLVHSDTLLQELWDRYSSRESLRSAVKVLRRKLVSAKMRELADAIDGSTAHHYGLMLRKNPF